MISFYFSSILFFIRENVVLHCMNQIKRTTTVVSLSLTPDVVKKLEKGRKKHAQSRSAFISALIEKALEEERWQRIYQKGQETAQAFHITSEADIDTILHAS